MVGLLIFILSRHGENSHWRAVPQIASEARRLGNPCCVEGRAMVSSSRRVSLPILPLWAGEHDWAHRESFLLQPWDQTQRVDRVWQSPEGASLRLAELSHFSAYHMASPGLALFFESALTQETKIPTRIPSVWDKGLPSSILILPWVQSDM